MNGTSVRDWDGIARLRDIATAVVAGSMLLASWPAPAVAQFTWSNTNAADTNWASTANWTGAVVPGASDDVTLGTSFASNAVTLSGNQDVRSLTIDTSSDFTMAGGTLTLTGLGLSRSVASSGTQTISSAVSIVAAASDNGLWTVNGSGRFVVNGNIALGTSGSAATNFTKAGNGTLELTGTNTFLGNAPIIAVTGGTLALTNGTNNNIATWTIGTASGQAANLVISGGQVLSGETAAAPQLSIGDAAGSTGTMAVSGGARVGTAGTASSGTATSYFYVGKNGNGTLTVDDTSTHFRVQRTYIGNAAGSAGAVTVNSGTYTNTKNFFSGENDTGAFTLNGGQTNVSSNIFIGNQATGSGTMTVTGGTMTVGVSSYVGENGTGSFALTGGTASVGQSVWVGNRAGSSGTLTVTDGTMSIGSASTHVTTIGGLGDGTLAISGGTVTSREAFIGRGRDSAGTTGLSSSGDATVSGGTWRTIGNLEVGGSLGTGSGTGSLTINGTGAVSVGGTLSRGGSGTITLAAGGTLTIGGDASNAGGGVLATDVTNNGMLVFNSSTDKDYGFALSGTSGSLVKSNTSTLTLSGTSNYTGTTSVSTGRLAVDGFLGNTPVTVLPAAELGGSGELAGTVSVSAGGTVSPGNSIESLITGAVSFASAATFAYEVDSTDPLSLGAAADLLVVGWATGDLNLDTGNGTILTFTDIAASSQPFIENTTVFALINYEGDWNGGLFTYAGNVLADGSRFSVGSQQWQIDYNSSTGGLNFTADYHAGTSSFVTVTAVPEPSSLMVAACGVGLAAIAAWGRRHQIIAG